MRSLKPLVGLAVAIFFTACQSETYHIRGEAWQLPTGSVLYLTDDLNDSDRPFDSIVVVDGRFSFQGLAAEPRLCRLYLPDDPQQEITFFTEPGNIYVEMSPESGSSRVSGTIINNRWQALNDSVTKYDLRIRDIIESANDSIAPNRRFEETQRLYTALTRLIRETASQNMDNALGHFISSHYEGE